MFSLKFYKNNQLNLDYELKIIFEWLKIKYVKYFNKCLIQFSG